MCFIWNNSDLTSFFKNFSAFSCASSIIWSCLSTIFPMTSIPFSTTAPWISAAAAAVRGEFNLTGPDRLEPGSADRVVFPLSLKLFKTLLRCRFLAARVTMINCCCYCIFAGLCMRSMSAYKRKQRKIAHANIVFKCSFWRQFGQWINSRSLTFSESLPT